MVAKTATSASTKTAVFYIEFRFERTILQQIVQKRLMQLQLPNCFNPAENVSNAEMNTSQDSTSRS
jgi:hypothetical protein